MSNVIRSLVVKVGADLTDMQKGMEKASKTLKTAGKQISSAGATLTKSVTVPVAAAVTALTGLAVKAGQTGDELLTMSQQTGISVEQLQGLKYASRFVDVEVEDMAKGLAKVTKAMGTATANGDDFIEIADGVTISTRDANGQLRDSEDMYYAAIDAIGGLNSETEKEIAAQELFGKSYQDMMPLINAGSSALQKYKDEAAKLGLILSDEDVSAMGAFDDKMQSLSATAEVVGSKIGMAVMPVLESLLPVVQNSIIPAIQSFADWLTNIIKKFGEMSPAGQKMVMTIAAMAVGLGPALSVIGKLTTGLGGIVKAFSGASKAFTVAKGGFAGVKAAMAALIGPGGTILLVIAAVALLALGVYEIITHWEQIKEWFANLWAQVSAIFTNAWNGLTAWLTSAWEGIKTFFAQWGPTILSVLFPFLAVPIQIIKNWDTIKAGLSKIWESVKSTALNAFTALKNGIQNAFSGAWGVIKGSINSILGGVQTLVNGVIKGVNTIIGGINKILGMGGKVAEALGFSGKLQIPTLKSVSIPRLAEGAVIKPNSEFLAMLGDQQSGVNIETPLSTMVAAFETAFNKTGGSGVTIYNPLNIDGKPVTASTSKHQYNRNQGRARALGVVKA